MSSSSSSSSAEKRQYQHFIPQFLLKNFSHRVNIDANSSRTKRRKQLRKSGQYLEDYLMNSVNTSAKTFILEECVVRRSFGLFDMYDDAKPIALNRRRIEKKFGLLESRIGKIYSRIIREHDQGKPMIWLKRTDKELLRKWIFLLKYRGSGVHQRYNQHAKDYAEKDRDTLRDYMTQHNIERPFDVWLRNLEAILDIELDPDNKWKDTIRKQIYPPDAEWFIDQVTEMFMTICTPANEDEEFILTENCCNVREGPTSWVEDENTGEKMAREGFSFHEFAPVSPKLMFVLRSGNLPGGRLIRIRT
ncbi:hypothetical protein PT974_10587 [Cladobotryum mycophilum]|uniref:DUF4238 domain-containing protein n=1 Tax=Cladobotryum mycophilum TaxID=491253 RepID=A0ABR0SAS7_9HYPO